MSPKLLSPFKVTEKQREWLEAEQKRTGNSFSSVIRALLQEKIDKAAKNKKAN